MEFKNLQEKLKNVFFLITLLITRLFFVLQISSSAKICRITNTNTDLFTCWYMWYQCQSYTSKYYKNQKWLLKIAIWSYKKRTDSKLKDYNNLDYNSFFFQINLKFIFTQSSWKVKEITHDLNQDLIFHFSHNPLCMLEDSDNV